MKKKRGKKEVKKKLTFFDKIKRFFSGGKTVPLVLTFVFLALLLLIPVFTTGNTVNFTTTGKATFLDMPIRFPEIPNLIDSMKVCAKNECDLKEIIVFVIVLAILFCILLDMLMLISIFSDWVSVVISIGFSILAVLIGVIREITLWVITLGAGTAILGGFIEIIVVVVIFVGLVFGSSKIALWAAKRKAQRIIIGGMQGTAQTQSAISSLRTIQRGFKKRKP